MNILVIEDDKETSDFLKDSLEAEGFVVDTAENGEEGLRKGIAADFDAVILDLGLPDKDGKIIAEEFRAAGKQMPIIIVSAAGEIDSKIDLLNIGADDYITKPFSFAELMARIRALFRRPKELEGDIIKAGNLALDVRSHTVNAAGKEICLRPREFFLLEYFVRNKGKTLSRKEILKHVWNASADQPTNTIEMHIAALRKKIRRNIISTVSGSGYKFCYNNRKVGRKNTK